MAPPAQSRLPAPCRRTAPRSDCASGRNPVMVSAAPFLDLGPRQPLHRRRRISRAKGLAVGPALPSSATAEPRTSPCRCRAFLPPGRRGKALAPPLRKPRSPGPVRLRGAACPLLAHHRPRPPPVRQGRSTTNAPLRPAVAKPRAGACRRTLCPAALLSPSPNEALRSSALRAPCNASPESSSRFRISRAFRPSQPLDLAPGQGRLPFCSRLPRLAARALAEVRQNATPPPGCISAARWDA